jgi:hypothetical protein
VDIRIGVQQTPKEIEVILDDDTDSDSVRKHVEKALDSGGTLWFTDRRGRSYGIPTEKVAYVEIGTSSGNRRIGFA